MGVGTTSHIWNVFCIRSCTKPGEDEGASGGWESRSKCRHYTALRWYRQGIPGGEDLAQDSELGRGQSRGMADSSLVVEDVVGSRGRKHLVEVGGQ